LLDELVGCVIWEERESISAFTSPPCSTLFLGSAASGCVSSGEAFDAFNNNADAGTMTVSDSTTTSPDSFALGATHRIGWLLWTDRGQALLLVSSSEDDTGRRNGLGFIHPSSFLGGDGLLDRSNVLPDGSGIVQVPSDPSGQIRHTLGPYRPRSASFRRLSKKTGQVSGNMVSQSGQSEPDMDVFYPKDGGWF